jgi:hypothetical protein
MGKLLGLLPADLQLGGWAELIYPSEVRQPKKASHRIGFKDSNLLPLRQSGAIRLPAGSRLAASYLAKVR